MITFLSVICFFFIAWVLVAVNLVDDGEPKTVGFILGMWLSFVLTAILLLVITVAMKVLEADGFIQVIRQAN